jgi:amino acid transporter
MITEHNSVDDNLTHQRVLLRYSSSGYKPVLHRGLDGFMNFAFGFTEVAALASVAITLGFGLSTGGPATLFWGFFTNFVMTTLIAYSLAEICGAYPSAGSVYHWAAQLSPREWAPFLS